MLMNKRGFTIVELLIVIVVIAILAAISVVAYSGIQTRARDSQRSSDISAIKKALELYKINNNGYPTCDGGTYQAGDNTASRICSIHQIAGLLSNEYLGKEFRDPINSGNYQYKYAVGFRNNSNGCSTNDYSQNYIFGARFESNSGNVPVYNCWSINLNYKDGTNF